MQKRVDSKTLAIEEYRRKTSAFRIVEARGSEMVRKMPHHVICEKNTCRPMCELDLVKEGRLPPYVPIVHPDVFVCIYFRSHVCTSAECAICTIEGSEGVCRATGRFFYGKEIDDDRPFRYGTRPPKKVENHVQAGRTAAIARYKAANKKARTVAPSEASSATTAAGIGSGTGDKSEVAKDRASVALAAFGAGLFEKTVVDTILAPVPYHYDWSSTAPYAKEIRRDKSEVARGEGDDHPLTKPMSGMWTAEDEEAEDLWNRATEDDEHRGLIEDEDGQGAATDVQVKDGEDNSEERPGDSSVDGEDVSGDADGSDDDDDDSVHDDGGGGGEGDEEGAAKGSKKKRKKKGRGGGKGKKSVIRALSKRGRGGGRGRGRGTVQESSESTTVAGQQQQTFQEDQILKRRVVKQKRVTRRNGLSIGHNRKNLAMSEAWVYGETKMIVDRLLFDDDIREEINARNLSIYQADMEKIATRQRERCDARKLPYNPLITIAIGASTLKACVQYRIKLASALNPAARDNIHKTMARLWMQAVSSGWCHTSNHRLTIDKLCVGALYQMRKGLSDSTDVKIIPKNPFLLVHLPLATDLNLFGYDRTWICGMAECFRDLHAWLRESQQSLSDVFHV